MNIVGALSGLTQRTDLAELSICRERPERCKYPPGYHEAQDAAERAWNERQRGVDSAGRGTAN